MVKAQRITGIVFIVLSIYVIAYTLVKLPIGTLAKPGPGFYTIICGVGILILSVLWLSTLLKKQDDTSPMWEKGAWKTPLIAVGITSLYAILMKPLGYMISTAVFIIVWQIFLSKSGRITFIVFTIVGTAVMYILFGPLLGVPLPRGIFSY